MCTACSDVLPGEPLDVLLEVDASIAVGVVQADHLFYVLLAHVLVDFHVDNALPKLVHRQEAVCVAPKKHSKHKSTGARLQLALESSSSKAGARAAVCVEAVEHLPPGLNTVTSARSMQVEISIINPLVSWFTDDQ